LIIFTSKMTWIKCIKSKVYISYACKF
jgi:hypothetical protein